MIVYLIFVQWKCNKCLYKTCPHSFFVWRSYNASQNFGRHSVLAIAVRLSVRPYPSFPVYTGQTFGPIFFTKRDRVISTNPGCASRRHDPLRSTKWPSELKIEKKIILICILIKIGQLPAARLRRCQLSNQWSMPRISVVTNLTLSKGLSIGRN